MKHTLRPLSFALSMLLAGCVAAPTARPHPPHVQAPSTDVADISTAGPIGPHGATTDVWARLRNSFAMPDCDADPAIQTWAQRYTRSPARFEAQLRTALPRIFYVQDSAARHGVPGEFALLPWVESHFQAIPPNRNRPAGMWQIMPQTARRMGLVVDSRYDGRLDVPAATDEVMSMIGRFHDWFQDWRLADYAYNAGSFGINRLVVRDGAPPPEPAVPKLPVRAGTRQHLVKLMAIACVVREPERFHVTLPTLGEDEQLVAVQVNQRLSMKQAAAQAGMPVSALADLNGGYRNGVIDPDRGGRVLLPRGHADRLRASLLAQSAGHGEPNANDAPAASTRDRQAPSAHQPGHLHVAPAGEAARSTSHASRVHVVRSGDTLFNIAHRYRVSVSQLKRWNHLDGSVLQVGQELALAAPD